jgi:choline transporter-like protein 2/4/5
MIGAVVSWVIAALYLCFIGCCWKNISLGASIMEAASDFVSSNLRIVLLPVIAYIISFIFLLFWVFAAMYLYSVGEPEY